MKTLLIMDSYNPEILDACGGTENETLLLWLGMEFLSEGIESEIVLRGIVRTGLSKEQAWDFQKKFRDDYINFVADWSRERRYRKKSFIELFTQKGIPLWWLSETSEKNGYLHPTLNFIFQLCVIREVIGLHNPHQVIVRVRDERFYRAIIGLLNQLDIPVESRKSGFKIRERSIFYHLFKRTTYFIRTLHSLPICRSFFKRITDQELLKGTDRAIGFYSWFPATWVIEEGRAHERMYGKFPELIEARGLYTTFFLTLLEISDPIFRGIVKRFMPRKDDFKRIVPIQAFIGFRDIMAAFFDVRQIIRYLRLECTAGHRNSLRFRGIDIYHLIRTELRMSFIGPNIPREIVSYLGIRNFLKKHGDVLCTFFYFLEFHRWERGLATAFRREGKTDCLVGLQHTTVQPMYMTYMYSPKETDHANNNDTGDMLSLPVPPHIILSGKKSLDYFLRSGFKREQLKVLGTVRFDGSSRPVLDKSPGKRRVLLPTTSNLAVSLSAVEMMIEACMKCKASLVVKPHPILDIGRLTTEKAAAKGFTSIEVSYRPIPDLLKDADVVVTTWTTIALESLVHGRPVIALCRLDSIDLSLFMGEENIPGLYNIFDRAELGRALNEIFEKNPEISLSDRERLASYYLGEDPQSVYERFFSLVDDIGRYRNSSWC